MVYSSTEVEWQTSKSFANLFLCAAVASSSLAPMSPLLVQSQDGFSHPDHVLSQWFTPFRRCS
jgi:hypothetical protein